MLGGRVAGRLIFGEVTTGAQEDLKQATRLARHMVAQGHERKTGASGLPAQRGTRILR